MKLSSRRAILFAALFLAGLAVYLSSRQAEAPRLSLSRAGEAVPLQLAPASEAQHALAAAPVPVAGTREEASAPLQVAAPVSLPLFQAPAPPVGQRLDTRSKDYLAAQLKGEPLKGRVAEINPASFAPLASLARGAPVRLPLMDGQLAEGVVNLVMPDQGGVIRVGGSLSDATPGSFFLNSKDGQVSGQIQLSRERLVLDISQERDGKVLMVERARRDVVCSPIPRSSGAVQDISDKPQQISVPVLNSRPTAVCQIYLDFDGETVTDPAWNNGVTIVAPPFNLSATTITNIFNRVKEDYWPFNINVTTEVGKYNNAPVGKRMRCIITSNDAAAPGAGGVAYLDSFLEAGSTFSSTIPCWVFNSDEIGIAEAVSHEVGHTFNLHHQGREIPATGHEEYYQGHGSGATSWCPIMGAGYYVKVTQWAKGQYQYANNQEDALQMISSRIGQAIGGGSAGYMADDAGNTRTSTAYLSGNATTGAVVQSGIIERTDDVDFYAFTTSGGTLNLQAAGASPSADLDIVLELQDPGGNVIATNNPPGSLNASLGATLAGGQYFIKVTSTGFGTSLPWGFLDGYTSYASLGEYDITGTIQGLSFVPSITSPATAIGQVGSVFVYSIKASGGAVTYTISNPGGGPAVLPAGVGFDASTGVISGRPTQSGDFQINVSATDAAGTGTRLVDISIAPANLTLGDAVDFPALTWTTGGDAPWTAETTVTFDGTDAAQAGAIGDSQQSFLQTVVDGGAVNGDISVNFQWRTSSELNADVLAFQIDGADVTSLSGTSGAWAAETVPIPAGPQHTLTWVYRKNASLADGTDTAWVDAVSFVASSAPQVTSSATVGGTVGNSLTYQITGTNVPGSFAIATGTLPPGLSLDSQTGLITGTPAVAGSTNVTVTASNNKGASAPLQVTFNIAPSSVTIAAAVDNTTDTIAVWTTSSTPATAAKWFPETTVTHDGTDALQAGPIGNAQSTTVQGTFAGAMTVNFWWKVESEPAHDFLTFSVDGVQVASIDGFTNWLNPSIYVPGAGAHTIKWTYTKDASGSLGADTAWLDQVTISADLLPVVNSPSNASGQQGASFSYQITATNSPTAYSVDPATLPPGLQVDTTTGLITGVPSTYGPYDITVGASNKAGTGTLSVHVDIAIAPLTIAQAVNAPSLPWTTGGDAPWTAESTFSFDGQGAARTGLIGPSGKSFVETHVTGPTTVNFRWTVDSELNKDFLFFYLDGVPQAAISGPMASGANGPVWQQRSYSVGANDHTLRWIYIKDSSTNSGQDAGWLDVVTLNASSTLPQITSALSATAYVGRPFSYQITANNPPLTGYDASPLPAGLNIDKSSGLISGNATTPGATNVTLTASNTNGPGTATLALNVVREASGADNLASATAISGVLISLQSDNSFATAEPGEPKHAGQTAESSIWWTWTAPLTGGVVINTLGSEIDTVLSVYSVPAGVAPTFANLTSVAENDNTKKLISSSVSFKATGGATYLIAVDGLNHATGKIVLNVDYSATGLYTGLLLDENAVAAPGLANLKLSSNFVTTGSIALGGVKFALKGNFVGEDLHTSIKRKTGQTPLDLSLHLDLSPGAEEVTGKLLADGVTYDLFARLGMDKANVPPSLPGGFTFQIQNSQSGGTQPAGIGYGYATVDKSGKIKVVGLLGDGTKLNVSAPLAIDKSWVLYLPPYKGGGILAGLVSVEAGGVVPPLSSALDWRRTAAPAFVTSARLKGFRYIATQPMLTVKSGANNLQVNFAGSDITPPANFTGTLDAQYNFTGGPAGFKLKFNVKEGTFAGSFQDATSGKAHSFSGAVLNGVETVYDSNGTPVKQTVSQGSGVFQGAATTGSVQLLPAP